MVKPKTKGDEGRPQIDRFRETASELGCDEDEAAFKEKLGQIARQKLKDGPPSATLGRKSRAPK